MPELCAFFGIGKKILLSLEDKVHLFSFWSVCMGVDDTGVILITAWTGHVNLLQRPSLLTLDYWYCMPRIPPQSITAQTGGRFTLWMWGEIRLRNWRRRLRMICCRGVTEDGDQGWFVVEIILCGALVSGMRWTPGWLGASEIAGWKCPWGGKQLLEWLWSGGGFWLLWTRVVILWGSDLTTTDAPALLLVGVCERSGRTKLVKDSPLPQARLDACGRGKIWIINVNSSRLTWKSCGWLTAGATINMAFRNWYGVLLDHGSMMAEIKGK